jgi:DNA-binding response OmpR family regulator
MVSPAEQTPLSDQAKPAPESPSNQSAITIAIVEDEPDLRLIYEVILKSRGYHLSMAANGEEFLRATSGNGSSYDLVLMDYRMPGMNGLEVSKRAREQNPNLNVIMASADDSIKDEATASGMGFILKPFSKTELIRVIENALHDGVQRGSSFSAAAESATQE